MNDEAVGLSALHNYYNYCVQNYGSSFPYANFDLFYSALKKTKGSTYIADGLGTAIRVNDMSDASVQRAMVAIAKAGRGRLPATGSGWFNALVNQSTQINFLDAAVYVTTETASDVVTGAQKVGDAVIDTGKSFLAVGPIALVAAALFILYRKSKSV